MIFLRAPTNFGCGKHPVLNSILKKQTLATKLMTVKKVVKPLGGNGGAMLGQVFDDDSDEENSVNGSPVPGAGKAGASRGSGTGQVRRRSSFGGARFKNQEEQARIVDMYTNIIKMSSENKINEKNSWGLDLIDHMGKLIKADSTKQRGVNFQKASCTLDASVKIYANRVDDTYSHSHRVLESFSRNAGACVSVSPTLFLCVHMDVCLCRGVCTK